MGITPWQRFWIILFNALDGDRQPGPMPQFIGGGSQSNYTIAIHSRYIKEQLKRAEYLPDTAGKN